MEVIKYGGSIVEIQSNEAKIIIDVGENLPSLKEKSEEKFELEGLTYGKPRYNAVFVSHYHSDHIGLYNTILKEIPIYIGNISKEIYLTLQKRLLKANIVSEDDLELIKKFKTYKLHDKIFIKDMIITPIETDHSAFDAHMLLIESNGQKILYTGDFRTHGQRGKSVFKAIEKYVGNTNCLICEGTTLSRKKEKNMTEIELQKKAEDILKKNDYSFVMCSSTNIDRIAAIHKATLKANRLFVCDEYQKDLLMYIDSISRSGLYRFKGKVLSFDDNLLELMRKKGFVMLVRDNFLSRKVMKKFEKKVFIYSLWEGYLDKNYSEYERMQNFVPKDYIYLHTSGHADFETIEKICKMVNPKIIIPIHGENPEAFKTMELIDSKIILVEDKEEIKV